MQGPVWAAIDKAVRIVYLNLLVVVTSLPVVTIGASITAAYAVLLRDPDDTIPVTRGYFQAFRRQWRPATAFLGIAVAVVAVLAGLVWLLRHSPVQLVPLVGLSFAILVTQVYFPLLALTGWSLRAAAKGSIGVTLKYTFWAIMATIFWALSALFPFFLPKLAALWLLGGITLPMQATVSVLSVPFRKLGLMPSLVELRQARMRAQSAASR